MAAISQRQKRRDTTLSSLNAAIEALDFMKEATTITPAPAVFDTVSALLTTIRVRFPSSPAIHPSTSNQNSMANKVDFAELGLACADACKALDRGMNERRSGELSRPVGEAIEHLTMWAKPRTDVVHDLFTVLHRTVAEVQGNIIEKGGRSLSSRLAHTKNDKEVIAAWRSELNRILHVFNVRSIGYDRQSLTATPSD